MAPFPFNNLSSDNFAEETSKKAGRKRPRVREVLSCWQCRSRKIRCDRQQPCRPCQDRGLGTKCTYSQLKRSSLSHSTASSSQPAQILGSHSLAPQTASAVSRAAATTNTNLQEAAVSDATTSSHGPLRLRAPMQPSKSQGLPGFGSKTRLTSASHWMAPCNDMMVVKAMVNHSGDFQASLRSFSVLKERLRLDNAIPASLPCLIARDGLIPPSALASLLPDRLSCEGWIGRYFRSYSRLFNMVDATTLALDVHLAFSSAADSTSLPSDARTATGPVRMLRLLLVVALAMQTSEAYRLQGRRLGRLVEDFVHGAACLQKPTVGAVQVLVLLILLKTISASDADRTHEVMGLIGLTTQITSNMGLHRDPALFPEMSDYNAETRKRLWASFLRLNLMYCLRCGTQLTLRLEDVDCPLPSAVVPQAPQPNPATIPANVIKECANEWELDGKTAQSDAAFCAVAAKLAAIVAPVHQQMCSRKPDVSSEQEAELRAEFSTLVADTPPDLQAGTATLDPMVELQQALLSIRVHTILMVVAMSPISSSKPSTESYSSQRSQLLEVWDYAISILNQFQSLYQQASEDASSTSLATAGADAASDVRAVAYHLLWADAGRAALSACFAVGRMRYQDLGRRVVPFAASAGFRQQQQNTASVFQQILTQSLAFLTQLWRSKYHLGPVLAKTSLLLAVAVSVTANLYSDYDGVFGKGVAAADRIITDMKCDLERNRSLLESLDLATAAGATSSASSVSESPASSSAGVSLSSDTMSPQDTTTQDSHSAPARESIDDAAIPTKSSGLGGSYFLSSAPLSTSLPQTAANILVTTGGTEGTAPSVPSVAPMPPVHADGEPLELAFNSIPFPCPFTGGFNTTPVCPITGEFNPSFEDFAADVSLELI